MKKDGAVTVYLSLVMTVMIALILALIASAKAAALRVRLADTADLALFSYFAEYDKDMLSAFDLFFADAGGDDGSFCPERIYQSLLFAAEPVADPGSAFSSGTADPARIEEIGIEIGGITLASDADGRVFAAQAVRYMKETIGIQGIAHLVSELSGVKEQTASYETAGREVESVSFSNLKNTLAASAPVSPLTVGAAPEFSESENKPELPESGGIVLGGGKRENPQTAVDRENGEGEEETVLIEQMDTLVSSPLLRMVTRDPASLPKGTVSLEKLLENRERQNGFGVIDVPSDADGIEGKVLFHEYLLSHFGSVLEPWETGLRLPLEYILSGKGSDIENLDAVVQKLFLIRGGLNLAYLYSDAEKGETALAVGTILASLLGAPEAGEALKALLLCGWAYCESMIDVQALLGGKKTAAVKTKENWQTDLWNLPRLLSFDSRQTLIKEDDTGLDYKGYLRIFLFAANAETVRMRALSAAENRIRSGGRPEFRLDNCIYGIDVSFTAGLPDGNTLTALRSKNYEEYA